MKNKLKIHLRDLEAEALDRLAFVYGTSKNQLINALIAREYTDFMSTSATTPPNYELFFVVDPSGFPDAYLETFTQREADISAKNVWRISKVYAYAITNTSDKDEKALLASAWNKWIDDLTEKTSGAPYSVFYDAELDR